MKISSLYIIDCTATTVNKQPARVLICDILSPGREAQAFCTRLPIDAAGCGLPYWILSGCHHYIAFGTRACPKRNNGYYETLKHRTTAHNKARARLFEDKGPSV